MDQDGLIAELQAFKGRLVNVVLKNGTRLSRCRLDDVFESGSRPGVWVVILDNGKQQSFDVPAIEEVFPAG